MKFETFDQLTKRFANRRLSRRQTLIAGAGASLTATGLTGAVASLTGAARQATPDATPGTATGDEDRTFFLFVQTFTAGTLAPHPSDPDLYTLTLTGATAQTVYFSDRPDRIVGTTPTVQFLETLGFNPDNPPNAALVAQTETGEDVVVVELFHPVYTEDFQPGGAVTLTYEVRILADYAEAGLAHLAARQDDAPLPETFGSASLFIDDCADHLISCISAGGVNIGDIGNQGFCWDGVQNCQECRDYAPLCMEKFGAACLGYCHTSSYCPTPCW